MKAFRMAVAAAVTIVSSHLSWADPAHRRVDPGKFLESYCLDCHTADDPGGEREFETLDWDQSDHDTQVTLQEIIDQITLGAMPPEDADQPAMAERLGAIEQLTDRLARMRQETASTGGRTVLRRLSRREYRRTLGQLLAIDMTMFDPTTRFPRDQLSGNFDNVGDALVTSGHLMECYLDAADQAVDKALALDSPPKEQSWVFRDRFVPQQELSYAHRRAFDYRFLCLYEHPLNDKNEGAYGYLDQMKSGVPVDGTYEIKVLAQALHQDTPYSEKAVRIDRDEPFRMGIRPGDTSIDDMAHVQPIQPLLAEAKIAADKPRWYTFQVPMDRGFAPRFTFENGIHDIRGTYARVYREHKDLLPEKVRSSRGISEQRASLLSVGKIPQIRIREVRIRGPIDVAWPTPSQKLIYGGDQLEPSQIKQRIDRFAGRAYRRPLTPQERSGLVAFYQRRVDEGRSSESAFRDTLKAVLCSPAFLYHHSAPTTEPTPLDSHALAERLSYFLTSSMPDETLRKLANQGRLSDPKVLRSEVRRLLASPKSDAFIADFLDSWLNLRSLGTMPPDPREFWLYYAGHLHEDMKRESQLFMRDLITRDASVLQWINADHSFINRDLAKVYGVADEVDPGTADQFQRFQFGDPGRGGLLGQASVMTVSANGIETSPVLRGVWILENVLGTPTPPPPDDVPAIDPDVRGADSIRDLLTKHRDNDACYQCHRKIDPLGFALESFDPIGRNRRFYDKRRKQPIDTSGMLPGGDHFADLADLKRLLIERKAFFVRTLTERLLTHGLGRRIEPTDRGAVDAIIAKVESDGYPARRLIEEIVLSELFTGGRDG